VTEPFRPAAPKTARGKSLRPRRTSTFEAIEDLLAVCEHLRDVSVQALDTLCADLGVELHRRYVSDRKHLYRRYLAHCLEDKVLTEEENADLEHLRSLLHLDPGDVSAVHDEVAQEVYGKAIAEVLLERGRRSARDVALREASTLDPEFTVQRASAGEFIGRSDQSFEDAVSDALTKARIAIPHLYWFEVNNISGYVGEDGPSGWHVTVRAGIKTS
jgi:flavin-binding protein dodecin